MALSETLIRPWKQQTMLPSTLTANMHSQALVTLRRSRPSVVGLAVLVCMLAVSLGSCHSYEPSVRHMVDPLYPVTAQSTSVEGSVELIVQVGMDGRVLSVMDGANSSGVSQDLIAAAKENARQWIWGPFPQKFQFPWYHNIRYVFKLEGKRTRLPVRPRIV